MPFLISLFGKKKKKKKKLANYLKFLLVFEIPKSRT